MKQTKKTKVVKVGNNVEIKGVTVHALKCPKCGDTVFSRARHDMRWCSCGNLGVDGGFDYSRVAYKDAAPTDDCVVELRIDASIKDLYNDWNTGDDKYGLIKKS